MMRHIESRRENQECLFLEGTPFLCSLGSHLLSKKLGSNRCRGGLEGALFWGGSNDRKKNFFD